MISKDNLTPPPPVHVKFKRGSSVISLVSILVDAVIQNYTQVDAVFEEGDNLCIELISRELIEPFSLN